MAKRKIPVNTGIHFELFGTSNQRFRFPDGNEIDFTIGMPFQSLDMYKEGTFAHLGLKDGAEILFKDIPEEELLCLIQRARRKKDVLILGKVSESEKVKKEVELKLESFNLS